MPMFLELVFLSSFVLPYEMRLWSNVLDFTNQRGKTGLFLHNHSILITLIHPLSGPHARQIHSIFAYAFIPKTLGLLNNTCILNPHAHSSHTGASRALDGLPRLGWRRQGEGEEGREWEGRALALKSVNFGVGSGFQNILSWVLGKCFLWTKFIQTEYIKISCIS